MPLERVATGIPGMDKLVQGGLVKGSVNLLTGGTGTGKTIFSLQYLWKGLEKGEPGVYITLEETPEDLKSEALQFGWDFEKHEKTGKCKIIYIDPAKTANISTVIMNEIHKLKATRLVIDSTSIVGLIIGQPILIRRKLLGLVNQIKAIGCTAILTSEILEESKALSRYGVEEFVADSVIVMSYLGIGGEEFANIQIRKMRKTNNKKGFFPYNIGSKGIVIRPEEAQAMLLK